MSTNTVVYIGYYLLAKKSSQDIVRKELRCSKTLKHKATPGNLFCGTCGSKLIVADVKDQQHISFAPLQYEEYEDVMENYAMSPELTKEDYETFRETFEHISSEWVGMGDDEAEVLIVTNHCVDVEADYESVHTIPTPRALSDELFDIIDRLKVCMQYKSLELRYGALVSVS